MKTKKKKTKALEKVEVELVDAQSGLDCILIKDLERETIILTKSCGYLIKKDKEKVILAFMLFGQAIKHYQIIPIKMVKKITKLT